MVTYISRFHIPCPYNVDDTGRILAVVYLSGFNQLYKSLYRMTLELL